MADPDRQRIALEDRFSQDLDALAGFLDFPVAARPKAHRFAKPTLWSWRKTLAFILIGSIVGWSVVLGLVYLFYNLF